MCHGSELKIYIQWIGGCGVRSIIGLSNGERSSRGEIIAFRYNTGSGALGSLLAKHNQSIVR